MPRNDDDFDDDRPRRRDEFEDDNRPPRKSGTGLIIGILVGVFLVCCGGGGTVLYFIVRGASKAVEKVADTMKEAVETGQSQQNLLTIGQAANQYANATGALPNNSYDTRGKEAKPLLSWRVHLLPYLGEDTLYKQFKLDEPWDSPNNIKLLNQMPAVYGGPTVQKRSGAGKTYLRGFSAPGGIIEKPTNNGPTPKIKLTDIPDGTANTILVVDAGEAVEWTKPDDLDFSPGKPRPTLGGAYPSLPFTLVLMANGSVRHLRKDVSDETLRMLINRKDGLVIPPGWDQP
jgi:hypothetical protein